MAERAPFFVRPGQAADLEAIVSVNTRGWQSAYRGLIADAYLAGLGGGEARVRRAEIWEARLVDPTVRVLVAEAQGELVGICAAGPNRTPPEGFFGEVYALYLLEEVRRRGIGRALFAEALGWLAAHGRSPAIVWALSENLPACRFYLAMGGLPAAERVVTIDARPYRELGFAYRP